MVDKYIEQAPGGEITTPDGTEQAPVTKSGQDYFVKIQNWIARKLRETGGPTTLSMGAVADGQFLKRSGTDIIGVTDTSITTAYQAGFLFGLGLANNGSDPTNDIDIATGKCRDSTDAQNMILSSALTKRLDASWAVGTGNGGLDTGSIANSTYHIFLIKRSDTGVVDALFSTSASSPTMPANYDYKRRIGSIVRVSAAIKPFVQDGDLFQWKTISQDIAATNPGTSAVTRTMNVPTGIRVEGIFTVTSHASGGAADNPAGILLTDLSVTDEAPNVSFALVSFISYASEVQLGIGDVRVMTNTSGQIRSRVLLSTAGTILYISTRGWVDTRGRLG